MDGHFFQGIPCLTITSEWPLSFFTLLCPTALAQPVNLPILLFRHPANENLSLSFPQKTCKDKIAPCLNGAGNYHSHRLAPHYGYVAIRLPGFPEKNISWRKNSLQLSY